MLLARARASNDAAALAELEAIGPPPYKDTATDAIKSKYAGAPTADEQRVMAALFPVVFGRIKAPPHDARYLAKGLALSDMRAAATAAYEAVREVLIRFDARRLGLDFEVPMFFLQGAEDLMMVSSEVRDYVNELRAPHKELVLIERAGHTAVFLRDAFLDELNRQVRPALANGATSR